MESSINFSNANDSSNILEDSKQEKNEILNEPFSGIMSYVNSHTKNYYKLHPELKHEFIRKDLMKKISQLPNPTKKCLFNIIAQDSQEEQLKKKTLSLKLIIKKVKSTIWQLSIKFISSIMT